MHIILGVVAAIAGFCLLAVLGTAFQDSGSATPFVMLFCLMAWLVASSIRKG